ncbi:MAG: hypothetical protein FWE61_01570 [Micrococcales bacterium]|nr:hypothetical protein [Micrococcales bacterium]
MRSDEFKYELHRVVVEHIRRNPDRVREIGLRNVDRMREQYRLQGWGSPGTWLEEWETLLRGPVEDLVGMCLLEGEHGNDMRQMGPFSGVISQAERMSVVTSLLRRTRDAA